MGRRIAIGDVHGCVKTLENLLQHLVQVESSDELFFIGDYVDRGPASKEVVDLVMELSEKQTVHALRGNHEHMLLMALADEKSLIFWLRNGGDKTIRSFGVDKPNNIPDKYLEFLGNLEYYHETEGFILTHAGLNFKVKEPLMDREAMLWIRDFKVDPEKISQPRVIHGHSPLELFLVKSAVDQKASSINLDNGCVYGLSDGYGHLCAFDLDSWELFVQENLDR